MALKRVQTHVQPTSVATADAAQGDQAPDWQTLIAHLQDPQAHTRRWAARELANFVHSVPHLFTQLDRETDLKVQEAIFCSLQSLGGPQVVEGLIARLNSDDAGIRNTVIEILQTLPEEVAPHIQDLLAHTNPDIRIFAIDILQLLAHPCAPEWLLHVLAQEQHPNVLGTAIDRLLELGTPEMLPQLNALQARVAQTPYLKFALDAAIQRIEDTSNAG
ncbi:HEAT repeat-containing protein [Allopseudospirillum japonicum]|uniref:HEAT repeat-containing protein n=1 Tax=Allopseudospirillum japonicum TaxID=64971 RepID=A0A1H6SDK0_9GAMM|nr:HEAT repeat domain-containing protein [Allopseudospirillum japonicum]SEI64024.1 HEAT repeat-containing protein [Allopseudospirillum japonicum]